MSINISQLSSDDQALVKAISTKSTDDQIVAGYNVLKLSNSLFDSTMTALTAAGMPSAQINAVTAAIVREDVVKAARIALTPNYNELVTNVKVTKTQTVGDAIAAVAKSIDLINAAIAKFNAENVDAKIAPLALVGGKRSTNGGGTGSRTVIGRKWYILADWLVRHNVDELTYGNRGTIRLKPGKDAAGNDSGLVYHAGSWHEIGRLGWICEQIAGKKGVNAWASCTAKVGDKQLSLETVYDTLIMPKAPNAAAE